MKDGFSVLVALLFLSAMLSAILAIAWATLGRARHARTWGIAFGVATVHWTVNILLLQEIVGGAALYLTMVVLSLLVAALLAIGFRQRAGLPERRGGFAIAVLAAAALVFVTMVPFPHVGLRKATPHLFYALTLAMAAATVVPRRATANAAERSAIGMLWLFVLFEILIAATALAAGPAGTNLGGLDRWLLLLGLPAAFTGTGLFAVFLLAADLAERMRQLAARDPLTGILNRRGFEEEAGRVIANAMRHGQPLSIAIADLDRFKAVNDAHGHATGDALLRQFAEGVGDSIRLGDLFGRMGGEEFVLLLVNTTGETAVAVIDRLRREVATQILPTDPPLTVTTSFGVAELSAADGSLDELIARADRALYRSKQTGRNRVTFMAREEAARALA